MELVATTLDEPDGCGDDGGSDGGDGGGSGEVSARVVEMRGGKSHVVIFHPT